MTDCHKLESEPTRKTWDVIADPINQLILIISTTYHLQVKHVNRSALQIANCAATRHHVESGQQKTVHRKVVDAIDMENASTPSCLVPRAMNKKSQPANNTFNPNHDINQSHTLSFHSAFTQPFSVIVVVTTPCSCTPALCTTLQLRQAVISNTHAFPIPADLP